MLVSMHVADIDPGTACWEVLTLGFPCITLTAEVLADNSALTLFMSTTLGKQRKLSLLIYHHNFFKSLLLMAAKRMNIKKSLFNVKESLRSHSDIAQL